MDVIVPNEHEAKNLAELYGSTPGTDAAAALLGAGVGHVVVTEGSRGCRVVTPGASSSIPPFKVDAVDTTGAGDVFCGFLAHALGRGRSVQDAAIEASAAAAISVTRPHARGQLPRQDEVAELMREQPLAGATS